MARISKNKLEYCSKANECWDCHSKDIVKAAVKFQTRGKLKVPSCSAHLNAYKTKNNEADARQYALSSAAKRRARLCTYKGCHGKLIPQEVLPFWIQQSTCGLHGGSKVLRATKTLLLDFISEHCLSEEERKDMKSQNLISQGGRGFLFFSAQYPGYYLTKVFWESELLEQHKLHKSAAIKSSFAT